MIDGIKIFCPVDITWVQTAKAKFDLYYKVDSESGAIMQIVKYFLGGFYSTQVLHGNFQTYRLTIKEVSKHIENNVTVNFYLFIDGSFHKNHFQGENFSSFSFSQLMYQIKLLESELKLDLNICQLQNVEVGVNIPFDLPPYTLLKKRLILYKNNFFVKYKARTNESCIGYECLLSQYSVKLYDKSKQYKLSYFLMRFELRYKKMDKLSKMGITCLKDLLCYEKLRKLADLLTEAWKHVLLNDIAQDLPILQAGKKENELLNNGDNPKFWERLIEENADKFNYKRKQYRELVLKYGDNKHRIIEAAIKQVLNNFFDCLNLSRSDNRKLRSLIGPDTRKLRQLTGVDLPKSR